MKRLIVIFLALLLLTGCDTEAPPASMGPSQTTAPATEPAGDPCYPADPAVADQTGSAVRAYTLDGSCDGIYAMGNDLVLLFVGEQTRIQVLSGSDLSLKSETALPCRLDLSAGGLQISEKGIGYYDEAGNQAVILDPTLRETGRVEMSDEIQGAPLITPDMTAIYYCTADEIRELDLKTGLSRLIRQEENTWQALHRSGFDGKVLTCSVIDREQNSYIAFLDGETGELLGTDRYGWDLDTWQENYFLRNGEEGLEETLFGTWGGETKCLTPGREDSRVWSALPMGGAVASWAEENCLNLEYYDLTSGTRTAAVELPGERSLRNVMALEDGRIFFLLRDEAGEKDLLCCWDISKSPVEDSVIYTGPRYTKENPDAEGLAQCEDLAKQISGKYGVDVRIAEEAVEAPCEGYALESEFRVKEFQTALNSLDQILTGFPDGFFDTLGKVSDSGKIHISLVRKVADGTACVQYWYGGEAYVAVAMEADFRGDLYNGLFHVMDTFIFNNSSKLDEWDDLNPKNFRYDYNYEDYLTRTDDTYLTGSSRAFIDQYSMTYPTEDRARIFQWAMMEEGADCFTSKTMQNKLNQLCVALRDALDQKKYEGTFPWEQFLEESLAYQKK